GRVLPVAFLAVVRRVGPLALVGSQFGLGHLDGDVRDDEGEVEEEGLVLVALDERQGFRLEEIGGVGLAVELLMPVVAPKVVGVVVGGMALAVVAEEQVEAALERIANGTGEPQAPLADGSGGVAVLLEQLTQEHLALGHGRLALGLDLAVVANPGVPAVLA